MSSAAGVATVEVSAEVVDVMFGAVVTDLAVEIEEAIGSAVPPAVSSVAAASARLLVVLAVLMAAVAAPVAG